MTGMIQLPGMPTPPASRAVAEGAGPVEVTVEHKGIHQGHQPEDEDEGVLEPFQGFEPGEFFVRTFARFFRRRVGQQETEGGQREGSDAGHEVSPDGGGFQGVAGEPGTQDGAERVDEAVRVGGMDFVPIDEDEGEGPRGQDPADGSSHADEAKFLLRIFHVRKGDGVGDGNGGDVEKAMHEHESEERPKFAGEGEAEHGRAAHEMAEGEKFLGGEVPVGVLVAEEHADDGGDGKGVEDPGLFERGEIQAGQVAKNQRQPRAPDEEFQHHHDKEFQPVRVVHVSVGGWLVALLKVDELAGANGFFFGFADFEGGEAVVSGRDRGG